MALLAVLVASAAVRARASDCYIRLSAVANPPRFEDFPAKRERIARPAKPVLATAEARLFRTVIREGAKMGPNFAGHFTIVGGGCGSSCHQFAIVDARSGRVFTDNKRAIVDIHVSEQSTSDESSALSFRIDSRLLIVFGLWDRSPRPEGVAFLEWTGTDLRPVRFVPRAQACAVER